MTREILVASVMLTACGDPLIRGGGAVKAGQEPQGMPLGAYQPSRCVDGSGVQAAYHATLHVIRSPEGRQVLVEHRDGYDSLVVRNGWREGHEYVYQVALRWTLHEIRVPVAPGASGRMTVARRWEEQERPEGGFRASLRDAVLTCTLARVGQTGGNPPASVSASAPPPPAPPGEPDQAPEPAGSVDPALGY
jgi:hypothetical protein